MFENVGSKIKALTFGLFVCEAVLIGIIGLMLITHSFLMGLIFVAVGIVVAYVGSLGLYGFGQLIENTDMLSRQIQSGVIDSNFVENASPKVTVICGSCKYKFEGKVSDREACPRCGSSIKQYTYDNND